MAGRERGAREGCAKALGQGKAREGGAQTVRAEGAEGPDHSHGAS